MTTLTHDDARRYVQAAADKRLSVQEYQALEAHLAQCPECRDYAVEIKALQFSLSRALRARWDRRRAPVNLMKRAQIRARGYHARKQLFHLATIATQVSSFAAMAALVVVLLENQTVNLNRNSAPTSAASAVTHVERTVPDFELLPSSYETVSVVSDPDNVAGTDVLPKLTGRMVPQ